MIYGSVCSGIEAATVAWKPLGWKAAWFSEIEPFPCRLLKHYYPDVPNLGDMFTISYNQKFIDAIIDLLVGGTPCQSFSIAGLRAGLASKNGNLALEYCRILYTKRPRWFVWENVPGALSSYSNAEGGTDLAGEGRDNGRCITETADFATILTAFRECGYSCAYRVLDAQHFGVPQRRRRIFVVGYLGNDWRPPAAVLFEPQSLRRNFAKGGKKEKDITGTIGHRSKGRSVGVEEAAAGQLIPALTRRSYADNESNEEKLIVHTLTGNGHDASEDGTGRGTPIIPCWWDGGQISQTLDRVLSKGQMMPEKNRFPCILYSIMPMNSTKDYKAREVEVTQPLMKKNGDSNQGGNVILHDDHLLVRRLTPLEAERLQGFPDNYTNIDGAADTPRYSAIGNSMAVDVMEWIGGRIEAVDKELSTQNR